MLTLIYVQSFLVFIFKNFQFLSHVFFLIIKKFALVIQPIDKHIEIQFYTIHNQTCIFKNPISFFFNLNYYNLTETNIDANKDRFINSNNKITIFFTGLVWASYSCLKTENGKSIRPNKFFSG